MEHITGRILLVINLLIMSSGNGTNAENIIKFVKNQKESFSISCVLTDNKNAGVIKRVENYSDTLVQVIPFGDSKNKREHEEKILNSIKEYKVDIVCLAGYMRILTNFFLKKFSYIINVHPSYLPEFPGLNSYERAFHSPCDYSGVTVHFVDEGVDTGEIILQKKFLKDESESFEEFEKKGRNLERELYPLALEKLKNRFFKERFL